MNFLHTFTYPILGSIFSVFFGTIPMVLSGFSLIKNKMIYTVAPKNIGNDEKLSETTDSDSQRERKEMQI